MDRAGMSKNEYVGIDISQERLDVALCPLQQTFSENNNAKNIVRLAKRL